MKISVFLFLFFSSFFIFAQREDHTWYFSNTNLGLFFDYNTNAVSITHEHAPMNYAGSYSVACDNITGDLMFYTDGSKVWDKNHMVMPNGSGLNNANHSIQTGLTCYYPGHSNHFFVFSTTSDGATPGNIYYSEIDLSLPGNGTISNPSGEVIPTVKNILLTSQSTEGMKIIVGTSNNYWLVVPLMNTTNVRVFNIDSTGIVLSNTYNIGKNVGIISNIEYSPVSSKLAIANMNGDQASIIMDFNKITGQISNCFEIPGTTFSISGICFVEWSPSGLLLYLSRYRNSASETSGELLQFNINTPSVSAEVITTLSPSSNSNCSRGLKLAPDGKIYHVWGTNTNTYLGAVNNPDNIGAACNYNPQALNLGQAINYLHTLSEPLLPFTCEFNTSNHQVYTDFICRLADTTHIDIPLVNIVNNPCSDILTYQVLSVTYGTANVNGDHIKYIQPNFYVPEDTIVFIACNGYGLCDTSETVIHLSYVGPPNPIITCINDTLYSSSSTNQWLLNGVPILGATEDFYVPTQTGYYSTKLNEGICYVESAPFFYNPYSIIEISTTSNSIEIFPNPVKNSLQIKGFKGEEIQIMDVTGKIVFDKINNGTIDISNLDKGIYFLKIIKNQKLYSTKFVKE